MKERLFLNHCFCGMWDFLWKRLKLKKKTNQNQNLRPKGKGAQKKKDQKVKFIWRIDQKLQINPIMLSLLEGNNYMVIILICFLSNFSQ